MTDWKMTDEIAGTDIAGLENEDQKMTDVQWQTGKKDWNLQDWKMMDLFMQPVMGISQLNKK